MDYLWIHTLLLKVALAFCYSFYNGDIPSNDTGLLLVGYRSQWSFGFQTEPYLGIITNGWTSPLN